MKEIRRLIFIVFQILDTIENSKNQPRIREIKGLLNEILNLLD